MKTILSSDYFLSRIVKILGEIGFVPGCLILLVLMAMSSFASAHHLPNSLKDYESFDLKTSALFNVTTHEIIIKELTPRLDETHSDGGRISYSTFPENFHYSPDEGRISFYLLTSTFSPLNTGITGTIYDAGGGIPGVVVKIKGTNIFTITDEFGQFQIDARKGDVLIFSYPDYETVEIKITDQTEINLELFPAVTQLEEAVINAGYYTVKDKERTGSIYKVTAKEIENQPVNNVLDALQGRVPGLDITPTTGLAGGGYTVRIRGQNSIAAGNEPLYIIDGVPFDVTSMSVSITSQLILPQSNINPLNTIDPASIESIEILKDADATAIYGSRGANGVILITTKKGKNEKTTFSIEASSSVASVTKMMELLNTEQYLEMRKKAYHNDGISEYPSTAYDINGTWKQNRYTNWQKEFIGNTAFNHNLRINVGGGNENTNFLIGGTFLKETSVFIGDFVYKKHSAFSTLSHKSKDNRLLFKFSTTYGKDHNHLPTIDLTQKALTLAPNAPNLWDENGNLNWENSTWENPIAELGSNYTNQSENLITNGTIHYSPNSFLSFNTSFGYTFSEFEDSNFSPHTKFNPNYGLTSASSTAIKNVSSKDSWIIEPQIDGNFPIVNGDFKVTIGGTIMQLNSSGNTLLAHGFPSNNFMSNFATATDISILNDYKSQYKYIAGYARLNYSLKKKYYINLTGRRDGSSRFGQNNRFANFGAVGASWIFSNEEFLSNLTWLSYGKLRGSFGITGNDQIGDYQYLNSYTISNNNYQQNIGLIPTRLYNPDFAWEKNRKMELALETSLFKDMIKFEMAFYQNRSNNLLIGIPLPGTTGFNSINSNLNAEVRNTGWELNLTSTLIQNKTFNWNTSFNLSFPKNKLISFPNLETSTYANSLALNHPISIYKFYQLIGINPETGVYEFKDFNGDGIISAAHDRQFVADLTPKLLGSLSNSFKFENWNIDFLFHFVKKKALNEFYGFSPAGNFSNQPSSVLNGWEGNNTINYQNFTSGNNYEASLAHSRFIASSGVISDASFIRLKSASISYKLPFYNMINCRIFLQGQNLLTLTKFKGGDPEQTRGYLPPLKRILIGMKIDF